MLFTTHNTRLSHHGNCCAELAPSAAGRFPFKNPPAGTYRGVKSVVFTRPRQHFGNMLLCKELLVAGDPSKEVIDFP